MNSLPLSSDAMFADMTVRKHYQLQKKLGEGGYGYVYQAWDLKLKRQVAVKLLKPASSDFHHELLREAQLGASLNHPAFAKVFGIEEDFDGVFIVMEMIHGETLRELIQRGPLNEDVATDIMQQIASAMLEAEATHLVHGDLKPSNLMLEPSGKVRILDFGLARRSDPEQTTSAAHLDPKGTIAYMAPEIFKGMARSTKSDIYALGVILYEMLTGKRPFSELAGFELVAAHLQSSSENWYFLPDFPAHLKSLLLAMTNVRLASRMGSMSELACALNAEQNVLSKSVFDSIARYRPRRKAWIFVSVAATALLLSIVPVRHVPQWLGRSIEDIGYQQSRSLALGLDALKFYDRPGSLSTATQHFETILQHEPKNAAAVAGLSVVYSFRYASDGKDEAWLQKAEASAQLALQLDAQLALAKIAQTWAIYRRGKYASALDVAEQALKLDPHNLFGLQVKITILTTMRKYDDAKAAIALGMQHYPTERLFVDADGVVEIQQDHFSKAEQLFRRSIQLQPDAVIAYANLNAVLLRLDREDEALNVIQQGLQIRPNGRLYDNLGNALFLRGDYVGAASAFESAVSPVNGNPKNYLSWANLADTLLWLPGRKDEAMAAYRQAQELLEPLLVREPNDATKVSRLAQYKARTGAHADSEKLIQKALAAMPNSADVHFRAAQVYELLDRRDLALDQIAAAKRLGYPTKFIESNPDLIALRRDPKYR